MDVSYVEGNMFYKVEFKTIIVKIGVLFRQTCYNLLEKEFCYHFL